MDSEIRYGPNSASKPTVLNVTAYQDGVGSDELGTATKEIREKQESQNLQIQQCVVNLSELMNQVNKSQGLNNASSTETVNKCWLHASSCHTIFDYNVLKNLEVTDRIDLVKNYNICFVCLNGKHLAKNCYSKKTCDVTILEGQRCDRHHYPLLHSRSTVRTMFHGLRGTQREKVLQTVSTVYSQKLP